VRVEVVNSAGFRPFPGDLPVTGGGAQQGRLLLAALALLVVAGLAVDLYLLTTSTLSGPQLVLVLLVQGALLLAAIALFWTWLETRILHPLRVL